jgi:hypothetical protein
MVATCLSAALGDDRSLLLPTFQNVLCDSRVLAPEKEKRELGRSEFAWEAVFSACEVC